MISLSPTWRACRAAALLLFAVFLLSEAQAELIPPARLTNWTPGVRTGVTGGIPSRTTLVDVTQSPYNADNTGANDASSAIQSAINAASSGRVVYLPAGTYRISSAVRLKSNVTLRGAGVGTTTLDVRTSAGVVVQLDPSWFAAAKSDIASGLTGGSTSVVVTDSTGGGNAFSVGKIAQIIWPNDPAKPIIHAYGSPAVRTFNCVVTGVSGSTLTITPPLPATFVNVGTARIQESIVAPAVYAGLEDMTIRGNGPSMVWGIQAQMLVNSWIKNVKIEGQQNYGIGLLDCVLSTITHSWITGGGGGSNKSGVLVQNSTAMLVYDNIIENNQPGFEINFGTTSSVFAYNLVLCALIGIDTNHGPHNSFNLYEGNITNNILSDGFFGGESETTIFRNWIMSINAAENTHSTSGVGLRRWSRNFSLVGNIIQKSGFTWTNDSVSLGFPNLGNGYSFGTAPPWRDVNSDGTTPYHGTLTTRTNDQRGVITVTAGAAANLFGEAHPDDYLVFGGVRVQTLSRSGDELTVDTTSTGGTLPPLGTGRDISVGPGGFQELDLDVGRTLVRRGNYYYFHDGVPAGEALGSDTLPDSLYLSSKPSWFRNLTWPPFDPRAPASPTYEQIPAGYRFLHGVDPPGNIPQGPSNLTAPSPPGPGDRPQGASPAPKAERSVAKPQSVTAKETEKAETPSVTAKPSPSPSPKAEKPTRKATRKKTGGN